MFDHKHYVPILKGKQAEFNALGELLPESRSRLTPLIDVQPVPIHYRKDLPQKRGQPKPPSRAKRPIDEHLLKTVKNIEKHWGTERPIFVDISWVPPAEMSSDGRDPLSFMAEYAKSRNIQLIPVTGFYQHSTYRNSVLACIRDDKRGVCVRLMPSDFDDLPSLPKRLLQMVEGLDETVGHVHLLLDFRHFEPNQRSTILLASRSVLNIIPNVADWRTLTLAGTSFPVDLRGFGPDSTGEIPRGE